MRDHHKRRLIKLLENFDGEDLFQIIWAANIVQTKYPDPGLKVLDHRSISPEAIGAVVQSQYEIHPWELETLLNEGLTTKKPRLNKGRMMRLRPDHFGNVVDCVNRLRKLENKEFRLGGHDDDVLGELVRIANRQFPWQTGSANMANIYRNNFVYGQGVCADVFREKYEIAIADFAKVAFALCAHFNSNPVLHGDGALKPIGVEPDQLRAAIVPLCTTIGTARRVAFKERRKVPHIAYKPSVLRQYPCIKFSDDPLRIRSPMPQLIMDRMTTGLFYDVVAGGGPAREEYGRRFEEYCLNFSQASIPDLNWAPEHRYRVRKTNYDSPDILCSHKAAIRLVMECKATRMSREAMYGKDPSAERGFEDLVKAVKQIWRFFAHCREGLCSLVVGHGAVGMVVTLDNWLVAAKPLRTEVLARASADIDRFSQGLVKDIDKKDILFGPIEQLERVFSTATTSSFFEMLSLAGQDKYAAWDLGAVHENTASFDQSIERDFPFKTDLVRILPWWARL